MLTVKFLPGVPEKFQKTFQIQVAHFEPDEVHLYGEGKTKLLQKVYFPRPQSKFLSMNPIYHTFKERHSFA